MKLQPQSIGRRHLKNHLSQVLRETVDRGVAVPISNHGKVDGYLVPADAIDDLERFERLRQTLPLLMAAVASGAAIPSQTLADLGIEVPLDWQAMNRFAANVPVSFTLGQEGEAWRVLPAGERQQIAEDDTDF